MSRLAGFDVALWSSFLRPKPTKAPHSVPVHCDYAAGLRRRPRVVRTFTPIHPDSTSRHVAPLPSRSWSSVSYPRNSVQSAVTRSYVRTRDLWTLISTTDCHELLTMARCTSPLTYCVIRTPRNFDNHYALWYVLKAIFIRSLLIQPL